ncbi:MAG: amino acid transporter [Planctomycetia bacterium]|nr:amino acid transporter [Planctomycetia bacterium]
MTISPGHMGHQSFWLWVMCLTGVDYFSTLGYQPSIAFQSVGILAPLATVVLVLVTLFGALPVYIYVAGKSPHGRGSIAMLEALVRGWRGKVMVLILLGFAATDFVITKTLSAADAAEHIIHNPAFKQLPEWIQQQGEVKLRIVLTMFLLILLGAMFLRGFSEVIWVAVVIVGVYLALNLLIMVTGIYHLTSHPALLSRWWGNVTTGNWYFHSEFGKGGSWWVILAMCLLYFPKLALGLSGFETGVAVMPLVKGDPSDDPNRPAVRIRNTRKLLVTAAVIMSLLLLSSSLITSTLIAPEVLQGNGPAANRALAYLAHGEGQERICSIFGEKFGTLYDASTVLILGFAGASAMAGLLNVVPQYLPRFGMAPDWVAVARPLVGLFTLINLGVTWVFKADVAAQGGAYATGVLVLMSSGCVATVIAQYRARKDRAWPIRVPWFFSMVTLVFFYVTGANIIERPDGIKIASFFILAIIVSSFISRIRRSTEMRFGHFDYYDGHSKFLWDSMKHLEFPVLVPHRPGRRELLVKEESIRERHRLGPDVPIVYIEARLGDTSEFSHSPLVEVSTTEGRFVVTVHRCASIAHAIAAIALELSQVGAPPEIHFGWSDESPLAASAGFFLFGEGNVPWMVRELIRRAQPDPDRRPPVIIG